ncbi:alpha/beta fold hydrolase [Geobacter sp. DSM 9736]|uniref:alpha/beta fold hydrolase n=1 Tax=Geobacter sp. DSM 9736 TaxID=1277350 RepID=UPI000B5116A5|nr:alpha/beta fold hydrolase [Geobacter sp. DSM 9736]SNB46671.1 Pimeloyl-ACP methyl ester carboxylesterase [Geobacter sp. DSM 9736]
MRASVNGITMEFEMGGSGTPVLLVHGFPLNRQMWQPQMKALIAAGYRVICPDLRGFGGSEASGGETGISQFADDLVGLLDHLQIERAVIGGMSMGGYVLLDLLERHPSRCSAACFIVTRSGADDDAGKARRLALAQEADKFGPQVVANAFAGILFAPGAEDRHPELTAEVYSWMVATSTSGLTGGLLAMRERKDYTPLVPMLRIPCLVIGAEQDRAIPPENSRQLASKIPDCTSCIIPEAGHLANLEQPDAFNACLLGFLDRLNGKFPGNRS